ncbi:hypothetical protein VIGAN_09135500, partial [Vigna angularis var. angularis]
IYHHISAPFIQGTLLHAHLLALAQPSQGGFHHFGSIIGRLFFLLVGCWLLVLAACVFFFLVVFVFVFSFQLRVSEPCHCICVLFCDIHG